MAACPTFCSPRPPREGCAAPVNRSLSAFAAAPRCERDRSLAGAGAKAATVGRSGQSPSDRASMTGMTATVAVQPGDRVVKGQRMVNLEPMRCRPTSTRSATAKSIRSWRSQEPVSKSAACCSRWTSALLCPRGASSPGELICLPFSSRSGARPSKDQKCLSA
jgi:hypothetical protein